ncbi:uroporphyrinogen-III synthase [Paenarthrobacter sp. NCHU4564]|uniref:uroporphyrinogen-III synthase n=1 Tax=Paenarthrobacter sp. NCHU4564 TaxID=3451353 RepID=UPI003F9B448E
MQRPDLPQHAGLAGRRILITRSADRARPLASLLAGLGAEPWILPLIDFERARDQAPLDLALDKLAHGDFDWMVITSITTIRALLGKAAERGVEPAALVPSGTRIAVVGAASRHALEALGLTVALAPSGSQSAEGLLAEWAAAEQPAGRVFLPQADIAAPALRDGLTVLGASVTAVTAYHTVDYPARPELRVDAPPGSAVVGSADAPITEPSPEDVRAALADQALDAVVAASPSAARRIAATLLPLGTCRFVAIGRPTAEVAAALGIAVAAVAREPTPEGIADALASVLANEGNPA